MVTKVLYGPDLTQVDCLVKRIQVAADILVIVKHFGVLLDEYVHESPIVVDDRFGQGALPVH